MHARVLDRLSTEQQQGAAPSHLLRHVKTPKYKVIIVDSPEPGGLPSNRFPGSAQVSARLGGALPEWLGPWLVGSSLTNPGSAG